MFRKRYLFYFAIVTLFVLLTPAVKPALADIYGYELRITAENGLQNGDKVPVQDVKQGQLSFRLEAIDPAKPNSVIKVEEWQVAVYSASGERLADFVVRGRSVVDNAYQATINALGDIAEQYNGQPIILKAKAKIGAQYTNEVSFRMVLGAESVRVTPSGKNIHWWWLVIWFFLIIFFFFLLFFLFKRRKRDEEEEGKKSPQPLDAKQADSHDQ